jgi:hypothetical protein
MGILATIWSAGRAVIVIAAILAVLFTLLWVPVLSDRFTGFLSKKAPRFAPRIFFIGLGILLTGLVVDVAFLIIAGSALMGLILLAWILDNY